MAEKTSVKDNTKKLIEAIVDNKLEDADKLLKADIDFNVESRGDYPIHVAARAGNLKLLQKMKSKGANLQHKNVNGNTPMHFAARTGKLDIVKYLKENGADMNAINKDGESPLHLAVIMQTMDVIELLVEMGMNPNIQSKETGQTPLHTALMFGRIEAMEALLIKGGQPNILNNENKKAEDVAKTSIMRDTLRMYRASLKAMSEGLIKAKGLKLTKEHVKKPRKIDRVSIRIESMEIPQGFSASFYCRREISENSSVQLPKNDQEQVFSDVFHVRISDIDRDCPVKISLPLYAAPSSKEEMVLRFIGHKDEDRPLKEVSKEVKQHYFLLETTLIPEKTCVCVVFVRPKTEENTVTEDGMLIQSEMEKNFQMDVPPGAFGEQTTLSLKVFVGFDPSTDDIYLSEDPLAYDSNTNEFVEEGSPRLEKQKAAGKQGDSPRPEASLLTDVFQINVKGQQPQKGVNIQMPFSQEMQGTNKADDIVIVTGDETELESDKALEVSNAKPQIVNGMLVFEVSHFCIYVAVPKERVASPSSLKLLQRQISSARDRKKPGVFFVVVKKDEGYKHIMMLECVSALRSKDRIKRMESKEYEVQSPDESEAIMMAPGDTFTINIAGRVSFEEELDKTRKVMFSPNRASSQPFSILLDKDVTQEKDAIGEVIIYKQLDEGGSKEVARLRVQLHPPPPPQKLSNPQPTDRPKSETTDRQKPEEEDLLEAVEDRDTDTPNAERHRRRRSVQKAPVSRRTSVSSTHSSDPDCDQTASKGGKLKQLVNIYQPNKLNKRFPRN